ncbi:glycosyltransferase [candidate division KSB1 bacterium]|nr:glycosyltransferase [candidate division KSB1 bacterium]
MDLSIIIPVLNESKKIRIDIEAAAQFLLENNLSGEIIIADDGSSDNTCEIARQTPIEKSIKLHVLQATEHRGKGFALRQGFARSRGTFAMFADSGNTVPWENALRGLGLIQQGTCPIAHGSRKLAESEIVIQQKRKRKVSSATFRFLMHHSLGIPATLTDTQCGFKIYQGEIARELYAQAQMDGFLIDIEIIILAMQQDLNIQEFAIQWRCDLDSRLALTTNFSQIYKEWRQLKRRFCGRKTKNKAKNQTI